MPGSELAPFTSVFRASDSHRVKRNRPALSCAPCQRRKAKCDRRLPCSTCEKRGDQAGCRYTGLPPQGNPTSSKGSVAASRHDVQEKLNVLEEMVKGLASSHTSTSDSGSREPAAGSGRDGNPTISGFSTQGGDRSRDGLPGDGGGEGQGQNQADDNTPDIDMSRLGIGSTGASSDVWVQSYRGPTSWTAVVDSIQDIRDMLDNQDDEVEALAEARAPPEPEIVLGELKSITAAEVVEALPTRQLADRLIMTYFNAKFVAVPYLHVHSFRRRYDAFWAAVPTVTGFEASMDWLWTSILFSIMSAGAAIARGRDPNFLSDTEPAAMMGVAARCLTAGEYLKMRPLSVEALLTHAHSRNIQRKDPDSALWTLYGLAVRLAQRRGYHRAASIVAPWLTPFEAEMRRRTWFLIQSSDLLFSFQNGMPPMVNDDVCDAGPPTNLAEEDFDEDTVKLPPARPETEPLPILAYIYKYKICILLRHVMAHVLSTADPPPPYENALHITTQLNNWRASLPPCLRIRPIRDTAFTDANYTVMHRMMMEIMYRSSLCLLHRPYLRADRAVDPAYAQSRAICRDAALGLLELHIEFNAELQPSGRMYDDRFMATGLTLYHFLVAAMVISLDLSVSTDVSADDRVRRVALLRSVYHIWLDRATTSPNALYASKVIRAILDKVETPGASSHATTLSSQGITVNADVDGRSHIHNSSVDFPPSADYNADYYSVNFDDLPPIDSFFNTETLDWSLIDKFFRNEQ